MQATEKYWLIQGYDGFTKIYEKQVDGGQLTESQVIALLKTLVAKAGLNFDQIVGAYAKSRTRVANDLLFVRRSGPDLKFSCGENPYFVATLLSRKSL